MCNSSETAIDEPVTHSQPACLSAGRRAQKILAQPIGPFHGTHRRRLSHALTPTFPLHPRVTANVVAGTSRWARLAQHASQKVHSSDYCPCRCRICPASPHVGGGRAPWDSEAHQRSKVVPRHARADDDSGEHAGDERRHHAARYDVLRQVVARGKRAARPEGWPKACGELGPRLGHSGPTGARPSDFT